MRYIFPFVKKDLKKKMVLIAGPRQSGKTSFVQEILEPGSSLYLNWDDVDDRKLILKRHWHESQKIIALDEIHKYSRWKNFLKGTYDSQKGQHNFIVTGSARLDWYQRGQDSMLGRYFLWHLHPLCLAELTHDFKQTGQATLLQLMEHSGFPEPFFSHDPVFTKRWRRTRIDLIFKQDIRELENLRQMDLIEVFYRALLERVGSEISLSNLARDLEIAPKTAKAWLSVLERSYAVIVVRSYTKGISRAVSKFPKVFVFDSGEIQDNPGAQFENVVALHLKKKADFLTDSTGDLFELFFIRERNGHEVDFLICKNHKPHCLIEAKLADTDLSRSLTYFQSRLSVPKAIQLVLHPKPSFHPYSKDGASVERAHDRLSHPLESDFI